MARALRALTLLLAVAVAGACTVKNTTAPPLSGPSELGLSLTIQATPDVLTQDGSSQSQVVVLARDANAQPVRNVTCRVEILVDNVIADFGHLSTKTITTGGDGRAVVYYTAPAAPLAVTANTSTVMLLVTPTGTDFNGDWTRSVTIRLVPPGEVMPPSNVVPGFSMTPETVAEGGTVVFDGSPCAAGSTSNCTQGTALGFAWDFGDGNIGTGRQVTHQFNRAGTFSVTLTVTDAQARAASTTRVLTVSASSAPVASFTITPSSPRALQDAIADGSASTAAAGRTIVSYQWNFGDGTVKTTTVPISNHDWGAAGTYGVILTVTDDMGRTGVKVVSVTVTP